MHFQWSGLLKALRGGGDDRSGLLGMRELGWSWGAPRRALGGLGQGLHTARIPSLSPDGGRRVAASWVSSISLLS